MHFNNIGKIIISSDTCKIPTFLHVQAFKLAISMFNEETLFVIHIFNKKGKDFIVKEIYHLNS